MQKYKDKILELSELKKSWEAKEFQYKEDYQELKIKKSQVEFDYKNSESENKRFKTRV